MSWSSWRFIGSITMMALSGFMGWSLNEQQHASQQQNVLNQPAVSPTSSMLQSAHPVASFSNKASPATSLQVADEKTPAASPTQIACAEQPRSEASEREQAQLMHSINYGDENKRYEGLLLARSNSTAVPENTLKTLMETDASDRVRLLAFENYLETKSGNPLETRTALQTALSNSNGKIQIEAKKLLEQFEELEHINANTQQVPMQ